MLLGKWLFEMSQSMNVRSVIWENPGLSKKLPNNEIHIWRAYLKQPDEVVSDLSKVLTEAERNQANQYYYISDKTRFICVRSLLKKILGMYLSCSPKDVTIIINAYGKPYLLKKPSDIEFSVTHSQDLVLYSLVNGKRIGIDVEYNNPHIDFSQMCIAFLSHREQELYRNTPEKSQAEFFLKNWTLKEAYVKALGMGHYLPFNKLDISLLELGDSTEKGEAIRKLKWRSYHFTPAYNYIAALVVKEKYDIVPFTRDVYFHLDL